MQRLASAAASTAAAGAGAVGAVGVVKAGIQVPSWPALLLAGTSIISKEWLYRVTKRVGVLLNSQILIANAWHHRSDAFSSVLSLVSIAIAITMPGLLIADSAAGEKCCACCVFIYRCLFMAYTHTPMITFFSVLYL